MGSRHETIVYLLSALLFLAARAAAVDAEETSNKLLNSHYDDGICLETHDRALELKFNYWLRSDWGARDLGDSVRSGTDEDSGMDFELREARLLFNGVLFSKIDFAFEYSLSDSQPNFKDVFVGLKDLPFLGGVKYGHMKEPFSLEELTSSNDIMFMERSLPNALVPGRNVGIKVQNAGFSDKLTWALGAFRESNDLDEGYQDVYHLTARLTGLPWYAEEGRKLIHLGLSYIHAFNEDDAPLRFEASPESSLVAISFVDTGDIPARDADFFNPEIALILGPFSLQGEYIYTRIIAADGSDLDFYSYYVQSSYFITGEHRKYKKAEAIFSAVEPLQPFNPPRGSWGALELALRYSSIDLDDEWVRGGKLEDFTAGLNWHLSKSVKLMFNYIRADLSGVGESDIFQSRFQVIF